MMDHTSPSSISLPPSRYRPPTWGGGNCHSIATSPNRKDSFAALPLPDWRSSLWGECFHWRATRVRQLLGSKRSSGCVQVLSIVPQFRIWTYPLWPGSLATTGLWLAPTRTLAEWRRAQSLPSATFGISIDQRHHSSLSFLLVVLGVKNQIIKVQGRRVTSLQLSSHNTSVLWYRWGGWCHMHSEWRWHGITRKSIPTILVTKVLGKHFHYK